MSKKSKLKTKNKNTVSPAVKPVVPQTGQKQLLLWVLAVLAITGICYLPMLRNEFTNWDDQVYVTQNVLLRGPDWNGIFTQEISSNYHPLTMASLAFNYMISGLDPASYLLLNLILHLLNTGLVFYFIYAVSDKKILVAAFTALIFGIHPMHVESVAWVSERKDVLYTFFFLLSLIYYWRYLATGKLLPVVYCFIFFVLSLLSKPAAIILPLLLLLLDYWKGRSFTRNQLMEKIPFFLMSILFAVITVKLQSKTALTGLDYYPIWTRLLFACYVTMIYIIRFIIPYPLSTFHPFPPPGDLGLPVLLSPVFIIALLIFIWHQRKNRLVMFSFFFFIINLLLVMQVISVGASIVSERYTYVPYIGLAFVAGMLLEKYKNSILKIPVWAVPSVAIIIFGILTFMRVQVWKNSDRLWTDVIKHYPDAPVPRTNRANYIIQALDKKPYKDSVNYYLQQSLEDCNVAIKTDPDHIRAYENRQNIYLRLNRADLALADANTMIRLEPGSETGYYIRGDVYLKTNRPDSAFADFNKALQIRLEMDNVLNNRGSLYLNHYKKYDEAIADFTKAININPKGDYYLNRSFCFYYKRDLTNAKADAQTAINKGIKIPDNYLQALKAQ